MGSTIFMLFKDIKCERHLAWAKNFSSSTARKFWHGRSADYSRPIRLAYLS
jgi:hypothetical protein